MATFDPRVSLATALDSQHGVYALLIGSGVSTGAGIPTGWGVVESLVRRAAAAAGQEVGDDLDAKAWWEEHGEGELGYSTVLLQLASTKSARRALLAGFFEPTDEDRESDLKIPGEAHKAIAALVRKGIIRVIVTTNFDRLLERALEAEGISPQILSTDAAVLGMEPMQHMACTIIKLHGDYAGLDQRNTVDELASYSKPTERLLKRVLDEYGLIVCGWSGEWDPALVSAIESTANRRYPLYWVARSVLGDVAERLSSRPGAHSIERVTADEFFPDLLSRVEALEMMSDSPDSLNLAIGRVKRALPDPVRYIELRDLFEAQLEPLRLFLRDRPAVPPDYEFETAEAGHREMVARSNTLVRMYTTGISLDRDETHNDLWVNVLQRAMRARNRTSGTFSEWWDSLQHLPALLLMTAGVASALSVGHEALAVRLLGEPQWADPLRGVEARPAFDVLHYWSVLDPGIINGFPSAGSNWQYPQSHFLKEVTLPAMESLVGDRAEALQLFHRTEYRFALATTFLDKLGRFFMRPAGGEFLLDWNGFGEGAVKTWENDFMQNGAPAAWGLGSTFNDEEFGERLGRVAEELKHVTKW